MPVDHPFWAKYGYPPYLYAYFGKTKVKDRRIPVRELAERAMWFIPVYNNLRKKDSLGHMTPVAFREANPKGTYPILL